MAEQRRYKRVPFRRPVRFRMEHGKINESCVSRDLSEGGLRIRAEHFIPLREQIFTQFPLEGAHQVHLEGQVVWARRIPHSDSYLIGVEFGEKDINACPRDKIQRYIV
ncbi:MAG: PilZ domain-containing protein [Candidatus Omnitrophota bacterium]